MQIDFAIRLIDSTKKLPLHLQKLICWCSDSCQGDLCGAQNMDPELKEEKAQEH